MKKDFFRQWEFILFIILIAVNIINASLSPYYLSVNGILDATTVFMEKGFLILPMAFVMILGDIDISVASTMTLSSVIASVSYKAGLPMGYAIIVALIVGTLCGFLNGYLISRWHLTAMIVTLATMSLYRGIAYIILGDQAVSSFPQWFSYLAQGYLGSTHIPFSLIVFAVFAIIFGLILHKTAFGRYVYAIGNNAEASRFSGVDVNNIKLAVFTITGLMSAIAGLFLTSRIGSSRPDIATGYELEAIAIVVLGGVSPQGGIGKMLGVIISFFIIGLLRYGMGLKNVPSQMMIIFIGILLIVAIVIPNIIESSGARRRLNTEIKGDKSNAV